MRAACSRASLTGVAAAKESVTTISGAKSFVLIVRELVDRQAAVEILKHLWRLARLSRRALTAGFHEVRAPARCSDRRRLPLSRSRVSRASLQRKCPYEHCARASIQ